MRCIGCGRFVGYTDPDAIYFIPYGKAPDETPPDEEFVCGVCEIKSPTTKTGCWQGPHKLFKP